MTNRLEVLKTYKLHIDGKFPRSESGRSLPVHAADGRLLAHVCRASRKDLREAVEAARKAQPGWQQSTAYLRGQILYRIAEMIEGKRDELAALIDSVAAPRRGKAKAAKKAPRGRDEVTATIDRLVCFAGWSDKVAQVLGCNNPVAGPHYNFTVPEPSGVVAVIPPDEAPLLGLVSLMAPPLCAGNTLVALSSDRNPLPAAVMAEACATGDVPPGVINILTGQREELLPCIADHRDIDAVHAAGLTAPWAQRLRAGTAENLKRVTVLGPTDWFDAQVMHSPWRIEPFVEMKTIWHPASA
ncbi:MAG: aldehyde dehydrogenase family protein [Phycisphaeraceae bacterium]|nr:aldehyde dehydrogenase family protein [Phycisphaerae bacterium]MBX3392401.1 aldehyde dehydrogenase family protein [Phycisphaeraceae bacterium]HRJ49003.1 aldehyde dehydrogenase family protein [Phycisphaerales bacterium]